MKRLMFYCQNVLGIGHLVRSLELVRGLKNFEVLFINGGATVEGLVWPQVHEIVNLLPLQSKADFSEVQPVSGEASLKHIRTSRKAAITAAFERFRPDVLVIELFPFGRLKFADEIIPLLELAENIGTKVACSVRDILVSKNNQEQFEKDVCRILNRYYSVVLVHSDPQFQKLDESFPSFDRIRIPVIHTGFVAAQPATNPDRRAPDSEKGILVSIGGGRVGVELIECAILAGRALRAKLPHRMRILAGPYMPEPEFLRLHALVAGDDRVRLERFAPDMPAILQDYDLSISMAGYNTCMNLLVTGVRAIVYPFAGHNNQEQTIRARKLEQLGVVRMITGDRLVPETLADMMLDLVNGPVPNRTHLDLNGAANSATVLDRLADGLPLEGIK